VGALIAVLWMVLERLVSLEVQLVKFFISKRERGRERERERERERKVVHADWRLGQKGNSS
jgi:hypothetical protein